MSRMEPIHKIFHEMANKLNNITTKSGAIPMTLGDYQSMSQSRLVAELKKIMDDLKMIENSALESGQLALRLKNEVYSALKDVE